MKKIIFSTFSLFAVLLSFTAHSQEVWQEASLKDKVLKANKTQLPQETTFYTLEVESIKNILANAPQRSVVGRQSDVMISLPGVEGKMMYFQVVEASNFVPELQSKFPEIKSYRGYAVGDPQTSLTLSISHLGLKAMIMGSGNKTIFIEPATTDNQIYASYYKLKRNKDAHFDCLTEEENSLTGKAGEIAQTVFNADDQKLRTFELAVSVTGEYTNYFGGTVADAMAAINQTMARVNAIYERDLAITMVLIANNDDVIYTNPSSDPYSPASGMNNWNAQLQNTLDSEIGSANYDIGHLFGGSGGGGNAGCIGCVCVNGSKGSGFTSPADGIPEGDSFDIDYVAHELGHQFGATHTFSRTEGTGANLEPGSGSTIMGYAGITGTTDVQTFSDDLFHHYSIYQITTNVATKTCDDETTISNNPPTVDAGSNYTIPSGTPFRLTATASDPDGDPITYSWEQANVSYSNSYTFPDPDATTGPLFRVNPPTTDPVRYFPSFDKVLSGNLYSTWESLSDANRNLNFVVQVRDNNPNVGQTDSDNMTVSVNNSNGPFKLNGINQNQSFFPGQDINLQWSVAGTNAAPFNSPTVNILLSTDGGDSFSTLLSETANDGSETISLPAGVESTEAYIMIESVGNIFYTVSPTILLGFEATTTCEEIQGTATTGAALPLSIPDGAGANQYGPYQIVLFAVPDLGEVNDVNAYLDINHTYIEDLHIAIVSPEDTQINLWDRQCGSNENLQITFDDEGTPIECATPTQGVFQPANSLNIYDGQTTAGNWLIGVRDGWSGDTGTIEDAVLEFCTTEYTPMSTKEYTIESNISVHPNPASDFVTVSFATNMDEVSYNMYDLLGRKVYSQKETNSVSETVIDLSQLPTGVYMLQIDAAGSKVTKKIIKN